MKLDEIKKLAEKANESVQTIEAEYASVWEVLSAGLPNSDGRLASTLKKQLDKSCEAASRQIRLQMVKDSIAILQGREK